jgi:hypothetical protein
MAATGGELKAQITTAIAVLGSVGTIILGLHSMGAFSYGTRIDISEIKLEGIDRKLNSLIITNATDHRDLMSAIQDTNKRVDAMYIHKP